MAATAIAAGSNEPDMALVSELLEDISRHPPAIGAQKLLVEHYISCGWLDAAEDIVKDLKRVAPQDTDVKNWSTFFQHKSATSKAAPTPRIPKATPAAPAPPVTLPANLDDARNDLTQGYKMIRVKAKGLLGDLLRLQSLQKRRDLPASTSIAPLQALTEGRATSKASQAPPPGSARSIARTMQTSQDQALELAIADLEHMTDWLRAPQGKPSGIDNDGVRDALVKRVRALESALPDNLKAHAELALMHLEHEALQKTYVNDETMLGDQVSDIPRANFHVTEDGYAWDMVELAQAITSNDGVMRNPLSRQMFTPKDIRAIVQHPHGKALAALAVEQRNMSKGIRPATADQLEKLGKILLDDQSSDQMPSRHAIDEFMAYCATLPEAEQKAINGLKCPAKDSHTGQAYDFTIGEAVRDAKGNRVCFHKTGDFLKQAAVYLRQNRGAPPDAQDGSCITM